MNYTRDFSKLESLVNELENQTDIIKNVDSWLKEYKVSQYHSPLPFPHLLLAGLRGAGDWWWGGLGQHE